MKSYLSYLFLFIAVTGCTTVEPKILMGTYREIGTSNFIRVSGEELCVHIKGIDERDTEGDGLVFKYVVWPRGDVILLVSRSAELMHGYPSLDYHWDGEKIVVKDPKSELRWEFLK